MAEIAAYASKVQASRHLKPKLKTTDVSVTRAALSVINGNENFRTNNHLIKFNGKSQNQRSLSNKNHVFNTKKISTFEDNKDLKVIAQNYGNKVLSTSSDQVSYKSISPSIEDITFSSEISKECSVLHTKRRSKGFYDDLMCCTPYKQDIYSYLKSIEQKFHPSFNYMDKQSDITMNMRSVLVDWLVEVGEEYKLQNETLYLAISYVDRFLSHMSVLREKLQLVGTASMFLAAKYEEIYPPELKDFVFITDDTYTKKQILRMEHLLLKVLNFDVSVPTAYSFLQLYCSMSNASESCMHLSQYICELSLLDADPFLIFLPSIVAAGSLALANYTLGFDMWNEALVKSSGYHLGELHHVISCLFDKYSSISVCPQQAICEKYKSSKYGCVTTIQPPDELMLPS